MQGYSDQEPVRIFQNTRGRDHIALLGKAIKPKRPPLVEDFTGESGARVESDIMVQESAPLSLMGSVAVLLEALLAI